MITSTPFAIDTMRAGVVTAFAAISDDELLSVVPMAPHFTDPATGMGLAFQGHTIAMGD